jgi:eukaryotic-like serine/threonine-protein kinase
VVVSAGVDASSPPEPPDPRIGSVLQGRYRLNEKLASGAMGVVYRGERVGLGRPVAVKFLHPWIAAQKAFLGRFENEARAMSRLQHPHCVSVIDFGVDGTPYLVMDFATGRTLRAVLEGGRLEVGRALAIVRQLLAGLGHAHTQGIVHRDLKPENLILADEPGLGEHVRILDFGLAKLRDGPAMTAGLAVGTPSYMSPEQTGADGAIDARTDLYTVGVLLFELLTGGKPFISEKVGELLLMQREQAPPALRAAAPGARLSPQLEAVVAKALSKLAEDRFQSAAEFVAAIDATPEGRAGARVILPAAPGGALPANRPAAALGDATTVDSASAVERLVGDANGAAASTQAPPRDRRLVWAGIGLGGLAIAALLVGRALRGDAVVARAPAVAHDAPALARAPAVAKGASKTVSAGAPPAATAAAPVGDRLEEARRLVAKGDWEQALKLLEATRAEAPTNADVAYLLATIDLDHHRFAEGVAVAHTAVRDDPKLKADPDLIKGVIQALGSDASADRAESLLRTMGQPSMPFVKDAARHDPNAKVRARAEALLASGARAPHAWSSRSSGGGVFHR